MKNLLLTILGGRQNIIRNLGQKLLSLSLVILLLLILPTCEFPKAQAISSSISGQVVDAFTGQPIEDATITVLEYEIPL